MRKAIYLVSELNRYKKGSGAFKHIKVGVRQFSTKYNIILYDVINCKDVSISIDENTTHNGSSKKVKQTNNISQLKGLLFDIKTLVKNHLNFINLFLFIKREKPLFIYERAEYLSFSGIIVCKLLSIPHYYEVNGISHQDIKIYYPSFFNHFARKLEYLFLSKSNYLFCVGGLGYSFPKNIKNWLSIQNGIDLKPHKQIITNNEPPIKIIFVAHLMPHHKLEYLFEAILSLDKSKFEINLVGNGYENIIEKYNKLTTIKYHGVLLDDQIDRLLLIMDFGIIPYARDYDSHIKLFHYGGIGLPIIIPTTRNFLDMFSSKDVIFFDNNSVRSLQENLTEILSLDIKAKDELSRNVYNKIKDNYTWDKIFNKIIITIENSKNY